MFNGGQVKTLLQSESHTISSFLSICGGLFGLFLGVSALSIIDLFYHFSLRLFWTIRQQRTNTTDSKSMENINSNEKSLAQVKNVKFNYSFVKIISWFVSDVEDILHWLLFEHNNWWCCPFYWARTSLEWKVQDSYEIFVIWIFFQLIFCYFKIDYSGWL